jgi:hypothetical protein
VAFFPSFGSTGPEISCLNVQDSFLRIGATTVSYDTCWVTTDNRKWLDISRDYSTSTHYCSLTNPTALKNDDALANPGPVFNEWHIDWCCAVKADGLIEVVAPPILL